VKTASALFLHERQNRSNAVGIMMRTDKPMSQTDPDNIPMTEAEWATAPKVPRVTLVRRALKLSQEEFSERYQIPIGTLRDWEQNRKEPDAAAQAYLKVIASDPNVVARALRKRPAA
jgi:putative transcriptional regulator